MSAKRPPAKRTAAKRPVADRPQDRRTSRRNPVQVRVSLSDARGTFTGRTVDVSRGGLFAATHEVRPIGTLLRMRVLGPRGDAVMSVGVVVRCFANVEPGSDGPEQPGMAIALTSTSEPWDRFWEDVSATDTLDEESGLHNLTSPEGRPVDDVVDDDDDDDDDGRGDGGGRGDDA